MPMKWPRKAALTGWFGSFTSAQPPRIEPRLTRPVIAADPSVAVLELHATPLEFMGERDAAVAAGNLARVAEMDASETGRDLAKWPDLQPYRRINLAAGATLYRGPGARRRLLIAFTGRRDRLGLPGPVFLQHMDAKRWDVLLLRDVQRCHFRQGVVGVGTTAVQVHVWLAQQVARYRHAATLGFSSGGLPAVWAGMALGVNRVICLSGQRPQDVQRLFGKGPVLPAYDAACACLDAAVPRPIIFVHGAGHGADAQFATALAAQTGGLSFAATGCRVHGVPGFIWQRGRLQAFLEVALMGPLDEAMPNRLARSLRGASGLPARANQIPAVAKGIAPDGD
jgi:hypothetical protein